MTPSARLDDWLSARHGLAPGFDRAALEAFQFDRLAATIDHARAHSPFYRRRAGWPNGDIRSRADLAALPFTTAADLVRADPPLAAVSQGAIERYVTLPTSGTSGPPKRVCFSAEDREATLDFFHHGMALFTRPGDRVAVAFPADRPGGVGDGLASALRRLGATPVIAAADAAPRDLADLLRASGATIAAGPPTRLLAAARAATCDGGPPIRLRAVLTSSDHAAASLRRGLARAWGCEVHDHWGMTETGYGGAVECAAHAGRHVREADLLIEVVDPASGAPQPFGESGEVVITTLGRRALPLLRYRTGDRGRLIDAPCACGSRLLRLDGLDGRLDGAITLGDGTALTLARLDEILFAVDAVCDFGATLIDEGRRATLRLAVVTPERLRRPAVADDVRAAVAADPALGPAVRSGGLRLEVDLDDGASRPRIGKRRIIREVVPCAASI